MAARRAFLTFTWVACTTAAAALAWFAVSRAVSDVIDPGARATMAASVEVPTSSTVTAATTGTSLRAQSAASVPTTTAKTTEAPHTDTAAPVVDEVGERKSGAVPSAPTTTSASETPTQTRSFSSEGGVVTVECSGTSASLVSATPAQRYTVTVDNPGPESVEVKFRSGTDESEVHVQCVAGAPRAEISDD